MKLADECLVDLAAGKIEAIQITIGRKAGGLELIGGRSHLPFGCFRFQELRQDRNGSLERRRSLLRQFADGLCHAVHLQLPQHDDNRAACWIMTHGGPPSSSGHRIVRHLPSAR